MGTSTTPRSIGAFVVPEQRPDPNKAFFDQKRSDDAKAAERKIMDNLTRDRQQATDRYHDEQKRQQEQSQAQRRADDDAYKKRQEADRKHNEQRSQNSGGSGGGYQPPGGGSGGGSGSGGNDPHLQAVFKASNRQFAPDVRLDNKIFKNGTPYEMAQAVQKGIDELHSLRLKRDFKEPHQGYLDKDNMNHLEGLRSQVKGKGLEVEVALYMGPQLTQFRHWEKGNGPTREVDAASNSVIVEVTTKKTGKTQQISDHISYDTAQRDVILYAPNYSAKAAKSVEDAGGYVARNAVELSDLMQKLTKG